MNNRSLIKTNFTSLYLKITFEINLFFNEMWKSFAAWRHHQQLLRPSNWKGARMQGLCSRAVAHYHWPSCQPIPDTRRCLHQLVSLSLSCNKELFLSAKRLKIHLKNLLVKYTLLNQGGWASIKTSQTIGTKSVLKNMGCMEVDKSVLSLIS